MTRLIQNSPCGSLSPAVLGLVQGPVAEIMVSRPLHWAEERPAAPLNGPLLPLGLDV